MRKIVVSTFLSLDGVMQAPGDPLELVDSKMTGSGIAVLTYHPANQRPL